MSWNHPAAGPNDAVLVGISWQETTASETLDGVTYGGTAMTRLGSANMVDLFYLLNPPAGPQSIEATWSGTNAKGVVAGAASLVGLDAAVPLGTLHSAQATSTSPSIAVTGTHLNGLLLSVLAVNSVGSTTTLTPSGTQALLWSGTGGTAGAVTRTQGATSSAPGNSASVTMAWTLGASKAWGLLAVEAQPAAARLVIDAEGAAFLHSPFGVNAADYPTLQAAVDAVSGQGGTVFIPGGTYNSTSVPSFTGTLVLPEGVPINLVGEGVARTLLQPTDGTHDLLHILGSAQIVQGIAFNGSYRTSTAEDNGRGIVVGSDGVIDGAQIVECAIVNTASWSLYIKPGLSANSGLALMCVYRKLRIYSDNGQSYGAIFVGQFNTTQYFDNCYIQPFSGYGLKFQGGGASFVDCAFEGSGDTATDETLPFMLVGGTSLRLQHCWFEDHYVYKVDGDPEVSPNYCIRTATADVGSQSAHNFQSVGCVFNRDTTNQAKLIYIGRAAKSALIEGCDGTVQVWPPGPEVGDPPPPSTADHITIESNDEVNWSEVTIIGCNVRDTARYIPLQIDDQSTRSTVLAAGRLRLPQLTDAERDALVALHDGDTTYNAHNHQTEVWDTSNWGRVATFQAVDLLAQTGPVSSATLVANPIPGVYRITAVLVCTVADPDSVTVTIGWRDEMGVQSRAVVSEANLDGVGEFPGEIVIRAISGSPTVPISYAISKQGTRAEYNCYLRAERL